ncbi:MAG TPA: hypothetical protein VFH17_06585 [Coriobacteriia bacterium]|nr:hypothetical protein [Coriobacteriia bacterium]
MARRSASNPRYQKGAEVGRTRRSAASAKPKRGAGDSVEASAARKKKRSRPRLLSPVPADPVYRRWRRIWLGLLLAALVFSAAAWWATTHESETVRTAGNVVLALAYGCIFTGFFIDFTKLRRMRRAAVEAEKAGKKADSSTSPPKAGT